MKNPRWVGIKKILGVAMAVSAPTLAHAQIAKNVGNWAANGAAHQFTEHWFSVALVGAAHTSKEGRESLEEYIRSGDLKAWKGYLNAFWEELGSTRLHTEIVGYHLVDVPVEFAAHLAGKWSPGFGRASKSFLGKQALGIIGFFGYDYVADLNRCVEERVVAAHSRDPLEAKIALERISSVWNLVSSPAALQEYTAFVKECMASDLPFAKMAWDRFWDFENLFFMGAIGVAIEAGDLTKPVVKRTCDKFLSKHPERAARVSRLASRLISPTAAVLSIGVAHQLMSTKPFQTVAHAVNSAYQGHWEAVHEDELQDLLFRYSKNSNDLALMREILDIRGALLASLLAEINLAAKPLWEIAQNFAEIDPAVRNALANDPEHMEERITQSLEQLQQVRDWLTKARQDPSSPILCDFHTASLTPIQVLEQLQAQLEELYFPKWWLRTPAEVAQVMRQVFSHFQQKAAAVPKDEVDRLRARARDVMVDLGKKFKLYDAPQDILDEHEKVQAGLAKLLDLGGPMDTQMLRKLELIDRYSHMPRPDLYLARGEDLNWTDPKWFRVLGQDPRLGLRGY